MKTKFPFSIVILCLGVTFAANAQHKLTAKFNHLAIYVTDMKVSRHFYTQIIGLDSIKEPFHDGKHLWLDLGFGSAMHIISGAENKKEYFIGNHLCLSTADLDQFKKRLEMNKIKWQNYQGQVGQTTTRPDGISQIWLQDPDGYWLEVNNDKSTLEKSR
jgi:lactoylglutathione lyase